MRLYYTYVWLRHNGTPYYVGKGTRKRGFTSKDHSFRRPKDDSRIIIQYHPDEASAFEAEKFLIDFYGRLDLGTGCLRNLTAGGEGIAGGYWKGKTLSEEHKQKDRLANLGEKNGFFGRKHTAETKAKIGKANSGKRGSSGYKQPPELLARLGAMRRGRKASEETKRRMSESHKRRWRNLKQQLFVGPGASSEAGSSNVSNQTDIGCGVLISSIQSMTILPQMNFSSSTYENTTTA
jgi:hypothetical protein